MILEGQGVRTGLTIPLPVEIELCDEVRPGRGGRIEQDRTAVIGAAGSVRATGGAFGEGQLVARAIRRS